MDTQDTSRRVIFNEENSQQFNRKHMSRAPQMIQMVIKYSGGLVKNNQQAQYVLVSFVVIAIVVAFVLFVHGGKATPLQADQYRPATAIQ